MLTFVIDFTLPNWYMSATAAAVFKAQQFELELVVFAHVFLLTLFLYDPNVSKPVTALNLLFSAQFLNSSIDFDAYKTEGRRSEE